MRTEMMRELLNRLNVNRNDADILVDSTSAPYQITVIVYASRNRVNPVTSISGHPVEIIYSDRIQLHAN